MFSRNIRFENVDVLAPIDMSPAFAASLKERLTQLLRGKMILIVGSPGSGKGSFAKELEKLGTVVHISTGDKVRDIVRAITGTGPRAAELQKKYPLLKEHYERSVKKGGLLPDEDMVMVLKDVVGEVKRDNPGKGIILDGFPRISSQIEATRQILGRIDAVIHVDTPKDLILVRVANRVTCEKCGKIFNLLFNPPKVEGKCTCGGDLIRRPADDPETFEKRLVVFGKDTGPVIEHYQLNPFVRGKYIRLGCVVKRNADVPAKYLQHTYDGQMYMLFDNRILNQEGAVLVLFSNLRDMLEQADRSS